MGVVALQGTMMRRQVHVRPTRDFVGELLRRMPGCLVSVENCGEDYESGEMSCDGC